jgi:CheY-like chemotaxis protein
MVHLRPGPAVSAPLALLADMHADSRSLYAEYLRLAAYRVEECEDGRDTLAKALSLAPDVVVIESWLPGINGYALCELLRNDAATRVMPIVVLTSDALPADLERAEAAGADLVLVKPCLPETLLSQVQRLLGTSAELRARSRAARTRMAEQVATSNRLLERSRKSRLNKAHQRGDTVTPPATPPTLICPMCDRSLLYLHSHIGGVSAQQSEQWDYFECATCGTFEYRQRTRKLRST